MKTFLTIIAFTFIGFSVHAQTPDAALSKSIVVAKKKDAVTLTPEQLQPYIGNYELQPGFVLNIFIKNGILMSQATNQDAFEMIAKGNHKFMPAAFPATLTFIADEDGAFTSVLLEQGGQEMVAQKVTSKE
jgi:hypothetical protein